MPALLKPENTNEWKNFLISEISLWLVYILRTKTNRDNPMLYSRKGLDGTVCSELAAHTGNVLSEKQAKTVERCLEVLTDMGRWLTDNRSGSERKSIAYMAYVIFGGRVCISKDANAGTAYYFEPWLSPADVSLICAAVESNHYLSAGERNFLLENTVNALGINRGESFYKRDEDDDPWKLPETQGYNFEFTMLKRIAILHEAIRRGFKIRLKYGCYVCGKKRPVFAEKNPDKESVLNPYAIIFLRGQCYLVATHEGYKNPTHYRIDRIYDLAVKTVLQNGEEIAVPREEMPAALKAYFKEGYFLSEKYAADHSLMAYQSARDRKVCEFLIDEKQLSIAVDHFGTQLNLLDQGEGRLLVRVKADYENIKLFCIQQCIFVSPVSPPELKADVKESLKAAYDKIII